MQDLLKEEEFNEAHHDPRESFKLFQRIAIAQSILSALTMIFKFHVNNEISFWIAFFVIPLITTIAMFRFPKRNIQESPKVKLFGILRLIMAYAVPCMVIMTVFFIYDMKGRFFHQSILIVFTIGVVLYSIVFGLCAFAIFVMSSFRDRRKL